MKVPKGKVIEYKGKTYKQGQEIPDYKENKIIKDKVEKNGISKK